MRADDKEVGTLKYKLSAAQTTLEGCGDIIPNPFHAVGVDPFEAAYKACRERESKFTRPTWIPMLSIPDELLNTLLRADKSLRDDVVVPLKQAVVYGTEPTWAALSATLDEVEGQTGKVSESEKQAANQYNLLKAARSKILAT